MPNYNTLIEGVNTLMFDLSSVTITGYQFDGKVHSKACHLTHNGGEEVRLQLTDAADLLCESCSSGLAAKPTITGAPLGELLDILVLFSNRLKAMSCVNLNSFASCQSVFTAYADVCMDLFSAWGAWESAKAQPEFHYVRDQPWMRALQKAALPMLRDAKSKVLRQYKNEFIESFLVQEFRNTESEPTPKDATGSELFPGIRRIEEHYMLAVREEMLNSEKEYLVAFSRGGIDSVRAPQLVAMLNPELETYFRAPLCVAEYIVRNKLGVAAEIAGDVSDEGLQKVVETVAALRRSPDSDSPYRNFQNAVSAACSI